ncbi:MAG: hypothetical protein JSV16_01325 [Candidatus Hydrogenedentota bacterium]|nr:MAG: hypothetical protein JSV16_01325 [Candidatus Hydrogenedentota bacterium]
MMSQTGFDYESLSRRQFLVATGGATFGALVFVNFLGAFGMAEESRPGANGRGAKYVPRIKAAFVRRKGDDGNAVLNEFREKFKSQVSEPGVKVYLRPEPIYSIEEAVGWVSQAKAEKADGLLVVVRDRQGHACATTFKAADNIPTVVFTAAGPGPTSNAINVDKISGVHICPTREFREAAFGLKMLKTGAKLREMRLIVLSGRERRDEQVQHLGTKLRYLPVKAFVDEYMRTPRTNEVKSIAREYIRKARKTSGVSQEDLFSGVKSYIVACRILEREEADGIAMDCHGAFLRTEVSLSCIAWSRLLDHAIPAACEADIGACLTHALVQYLFDRPGFEHNPVPETARGCLIGSHCTCPTRLNGFSKPPEPFELLRQHEDQGAVPRPLWRVGQRVTVAKLDTAEQLTAKGKPPGTSPRLYVSAGTVVENVSVRPAGNCAVSVMVRLDGERDLLAYPDFHQLFFYGDYKRELLEYCKLFAIQTVAV